jgi:hypothetical protein
MSASLPAGIVLTTQQWFEECLKRGCTVLHFPPNSSPRGINKLNNGSTCLILAKPRPGAPREEWVFLGELTVKNVKRVRGEEFHVYASRAVIVEESPHPKPGESSWIIEFESLTTYRRPVKLAECDVRTSTSKRPLKDWVILGFTFIRPEDAGKVIGYIRSLAGVRVVEDREVTHDVLVEELLNMGKWLGFVVRRDEPTPDNVYKLDVTWRDVEGHRPLKAFEVEFSGDVDRALARLAHAHDIWGCEQLWLIVSDEADSERARKLLEPRLKGSFARIRGKVIIMGWKDIHNMYKSLEPHKKLLEMLSKR